MQYESYLNQQQQLPCEGKHIIAHHDAETIVVYQAYHPGIAEYALTHQTFGGADYSFARMTWIKPNFLWMMYRSGWATKPNQERILAIRMSMEGFREILGQAVESSYQPSSYPKREDWKAALGQSSVRLQWDPDHGPKGQKLVRKAIQLGLRGNILQQWNKEWILSIADMTPFVEEQRLYARTDVGQLQVPVERVVELPFLSS